MDFDKHGSTIFRVKLNSAEKRALDEEIKKAFEEFDKEHWTEIDAMVLWVLKERFGWGHKRLRDFYDAFGPVFDGLLKRYEMSGKDGMWLCTHRLKEYGVDLEQWAKEKEKEKEKNE